MSLVYDLRRQRGQFGGAAANVAPHGWAEDNTGHLLSVCFLWCAATERCNVPEHPGVPTCVALYPWRGGGGGGLAEVPPQPAGRRPRCWGPGLRAWHRAGTIAAVYEGQGLILTLGVFVFVLFFHRKVT